MKRSLVITFALVFFVLALVLSSPLAYRTALADDTKRDKCVTCLGKVERDYQKCVADQGGETQACGEAFNQNIIACYATVCEQ